MRTADVIRALIQEGTLRVDANGAIWRTAIKTPSGRKEIPPRRAESIGGKGYLRVVVRVESGKVAGIGAHRVVWETLRGPIPEGMQINHKDLNKQNNHPDNLEVVTGSENMNHSYANGRPRPWSASTEWRGRRIVSTPENIATAASMRDRGASLKEIAAHFGVGISHAQRLAARGVRP